MNRKDLLRYLVIGGGLLIGLWACRHSLYDDGSSGDHPKFSIRQAREAFEGQLISTKGRFRGNDEPTQFNPGEFTPRWNRAKINGNNQRQYADVPIDPHFVYRAWYYKVKPDGDTTFQSVNVAQKLVVKHWS